MPDFDWWTALSAAVGAAGGSVLPEVIASLVRRSQESEQRRDADVAEIVETVSAVRDRCDEYWIKSAKDLGERDSILSAHINASLLHLSQVVAGLFTGPPKYECDVACVALMDAAGGGDFGNPDRLADPGRLMLVHQKALAFQNTVKRERRGLRKKWWL